MHLNLRLGTLALALGLAHSAFATDLNEVWQAAWQNDRDYAVARAAQAAAQPRHEQSAALWRPRVALTAGVGLGSSETDATGAQFLAPGLGSNSGVGFNTSVTGGTATRWTLSAAQPLYNPERRAQQRQIELSLGVAELEWQLARQNLMLNTAQRYFDLALAQETLAVLQRQLATVQRASTEVQDRFRLGAVPVTDTHEAQARLADIQAQVLLARNDWQFKRDRLADSTGLPAKSLSARLPLFAAEPSSLGPLEPWLQRTQDRNPGLRMRLAATEVARQEVGKFSARAAASVDLVAQTSREHLGGSGAYGSAGNTASNSFVGLQLSVPLWTGGYRNAKQEEAVLLADKAAAETDLTRQDLEQQVRASWLNLSIGSERLRALTQGLAASTARLDATRLGQQVGHRTTQDLMNAESDAARARLALAQARVALVLERLRLEVLAGDLSDDLLRGVDANLALEGRP
jgi:outer membrane protein